MPQFAIKSSGIKQVATAKLLGRSSSGTGTAEELSASTAKTLLGLGSSDKPAFAAITQLSSSSGDPTTGEVSAGTWQLHKNTSTSKIYLAVNDGGSIVKQELGVTGGAGYDQSLNKSDDVEFDDVTSTGQVFVPSATSTNPSICFTGDAQKRTGFFEPDADTAIGVSVAAGERHSFHSNNIRTRSGNSYSWVDGIDPSGGTVDLSLFRGAAGVLEQRNGANAQTLRVFNTWTDASNYEAVSMKWSSNVAVIDTEKAGTGSSRDLDLFRAGSRKIRIGSSIKFYNHIRFNGSSYDIGERVNLSSARHLYLNQSANCGNSTTSGSVNIHNLWNDSSNYESLKFSWDSDVAKIGTVSAGTGTTRAMEIYGGNLTISPTVIKLTNLPTSDPSVAGQLWSDASGGGLGSAPVLKISAG
tara:strand:- start:1614 stop:2852 length:1239 start_codon:yes stop_codon:yes gene_type:complete